MGLLSFLSGGSQPHFADSVAPVIGAGHDTSKRVRILPTFGTRKKNKKMNSPRRICRVEELERREMLAANPIDFGGVYHENSFQNDLTGDTFHITYEGGEEGTQLKEIVISLDKNGNGVIDPGENFFHDGTLTTKGSFESFGFQFISASWFDLSNGKTWSDYFEFKLTNSQTLVLTFKDGFTAGETFSFMIDVDEVDEVYKVGDTVKGTDHVVTAADLQNANYAVKRCNAVVEGAEFHGSVITGTFVHKNYENLTMDAVYQDDYPDEDDPNYEQYLKLKLPSDDYLGQPNSNGRVATAGGFAHAVQTPKPISIEGNVYEDLNQNKTFDGDEKGIGGVDLELQIWNEKTGKYETVDRTTTDKHGHYKFEGLAPGKYRIVETQPEGYKSVDSQAGTVDGSVRGLSETVDILAEIELVGGEDSVNNNFGEIRPGAISGYVYEDDNDNGVKDAGEAGIDEVTVDLYVWDATQEKYVFLKTTQTKNGGYYEFKDLDPNKTYMLKETQPKGYLDGKEKVGDLGGELPAVDDDTILKIVIGVAQFGKDYNFGELKPSTISGHVAADTNGNNKLDSGDAYLSGVTVYLYDAYGNKIAETKTDKNGFYKFENLKPGVYEVRETQPYGYNVTEDGNVAVYDAASLKSILNRIYDGPDFVGTHDGQLVEPDTITHIAIVTAGTDAKDYDFLEIPGGCIEGYVYEDDNNNGVRDAGEKGIAGVVIKLYDANGNFVAEVKTDANGKYSFCGLEPNVNYTITEDQPDGYCDGKESQGMIDGEKYGDISINDKISGIPVKPGKKGTEFNFGELKYSSIAGYVYEDLDNDGVKEAGESGIKDVTVELWVWSETENKYVKTNRTAVTDENGRYIFEDLCPYKKFRIVEIQPSGWISGKKKEGTLGGTASDPNDWITDIELTPDQHGENYNFGELKEATLSGYVYEDVTINGGRADGTKTDNGVKDSGEKGIKDVTVQLWMWNDTDKKYELIKTTTTNGDGYYEFKGLKPGRYQIIEIQPEEYFDGKDSLGTTDGTNPNGQAENDKFTSIEIVSGSKGVNYNFGELIPAKISGYVFQDGDRITYSDTKPNVEDVRNGIRGNGSKPIQGVTLILCNANGDPWLDEDGNFIVAVTDENGYYVFEGLPAGNYAIREVQPSDYEQGLNTVGDLGGYAQNPGSPLDPTVLSTLAGNDPTDLIFMINLNYGEHSANNNFSEVLYTYESPTIDPPPPSPPVVPGPPNMPLGNPNFSYGLMYTPPTLNQTWTPGIGGGGLPSTYTWHLSVINAGYPRSVLSDYDVANGYRAQGVYMNVAWQSYDMGQTQWTVYNSDGKAEASYNFGPGFGTAIAGDFNGDGIAEMAVYCDGYWFVDLNGNGSWDDDDLWIRMGSENDQPVVGDWDGDGKADIGVFGPEWPGDMNALQNEPGLPSDLNRKVAARPKNVPPNPQDAPAQVRAMKHTTRGRVRLDVIDHVFRYGSEADRAVVGDWNGDGTKKIGVYRNGTWYIDYNGNGQWDAGDVEAKTNGQAGDIPLVGDFTGEGVDRIALYTPSTGRVIIDTNGDFQLDDRDRIFYLEGIDDVEAFPVVGDFNGDGIDQIALVKHIEKIPMQTRLIPSMPATMPTSVEAPGSPAISSEFVPGEWGSNRGVEEFGFQE